MADAELIDAPSGSAPSARPAEEPKNVWTHGDSIKFFAVIFVLFFAVNSDMFIENVLAQLGDGMLRSSGAPNSRGTLVQGLAFVVLAMVAMWLISGGAL